MSNPYYEQEMIRQIDQKMRELDYKLEALESPKKKRGPKKCMHPIHDIGSAFNYLNHTTTVIGNDFHNCLIATHSGKDALECLHTLTKQLSTLNCDKITNSMKKCKESTNIPAATLKCLDKASTADQVNVCIGNSLDIELSSHISKGKNMYKSTFIHNGSHNRRPHVVHPLACTRRGSCRI